MTSSQDAARVPLQDSARAVPPGTKWLGSVDPSEPIMFTIRLRAAHVVPPAPLGDEEHAVAADAGAGQALETPEADRGAFETLQAFADQSGLAVIEVNQAQRKVVLWSTAGKIAAALGISFAHYEYSGKVRRGLIGPIYLPAALAEIVEDVSGLDDGLPDWVSSAIMSRSDQKASARPPLKSQLLFAVGGALVAFGIFLYWAHAFGRPAALQSGKAVQLAVQRPAAVTASEPVPVPQNAVAPQPLSAAAAQQNLARLEAAGWAALDAGRLQDAQDHFLNALAADPGRRNAMRGLVAVREEMAADDPLTVRRQMAVYQNAIAHGSVIDDKYATPALKILVSAGMTAATELEARRGTGAADHPATIPASAPLMPPQAPVPSRGDAARPAAAPAGAPPKASEHAAPRPAAPATPPAPAPAAPAPQKPTAPAATVPQKPPLPPAAAAQPAPVVLPQKPAVQSALAPVLPPPHAPAAPNPQTLQPNRLYLVRVGPLMSRDRAATIVRQLSAGGFPQAQVSAQTGYRVLSEPLPRKTAETVIASLAGHGLHANTESSTGDTVQLLFGVFASPRDAEGLSARIATAGYDAWIRESTVYTVSAGPYPPASVTAITGIVKTGAPDARVSVDPSGAPATPSVPAPSTGARPVPVPPVPPAPATPDPAAIPGSAGAPTLLPNRLYTIRVGPVMSRDRAAAIVKQLSAGGFPQAQAGAQTGHLVLSEPLPRKAAESLIASLAAHGLHADVQSLTGDTVQLLFGVFTSQKDAEALSAKIAAAGYDAWIRDGTVYTVSVGPYPSSSVSAITGIVKIGAPDTAVSVDPGR